MAELSSATPADLAHLVERDLAKVEVAGSSPVIRSKFGSLAQLVRASALQAGGHRFESCSSHQSKAP